MKHIVAYGLVLLASVVSFAQDTTSGPTIEIHVNGGRPMTMGVADLAKLPRHSVTITEHEKQIPFEGVLLRDVLQQAGAPIGDKLRGKALSTYVLATAHDGYAVVYTLTELDPSFTDGEVIVADKSGGQPLSATQGPFRIVVPHEKKPARSLRMLERIDVVQLRQ
jgi:DMSO/TMAO reductase YedYZ molybdopterin-dependent catalytic subunit